MPTPFPGVDPYLERPSLWPDVHNRPLVLLAAQLAPLLRPHYYAALEERTYLVEPAELVLAGHANVLRIDYRGEPEPPLAGDDAAWADALLRAAGLR